MPDSNLTHARWTESERVSALAVYAETNSATEASRITGVPTSTIVDWTNSEQGAATIVQLRSILRERVAWMHAETVIKATQLLHERLAHGDEVVLANGAKVHRAVPARDLMMIVAVSQDKHAQLVGQLEGNRQVDKALESLASKLMDKLAKRKDKQSVTLDAKPNVDTSSLMG